MKVLSNKIYNSVILKLWYQHFGISTLILTLVSKKATIWRLEESQSNDKLLQKTMTPVIKWNKKHSSKQVVSTTYTLEETFLVAATFEVL